MKDLICDLVLLAGCLVVTAMVLGYSAWVAFEAYIELVR